ncbi:MAG: proline--tRNA ligase [Chloroflexota bacterium]
MRLSELFTRTLRDAPADAELVSHKLAVRAGLVRPVAAGIYALMPLGWRVMHKIEAILREEMDALGGQEVRLPVVHPAELWQATGRWETFGPVLQKFAAESGREYALGPTHEEVIAALAAREIDSYKQLPQHLYQIQTKYRNEPRARGGLIRLREFTMKDAYSLDADAAGLDRFYPRMVAAYERIFERAGVPALAVEADSGAMGGGVSHEFMLVHEAGEDSFARCDACGYAANLEAAEFALPAPPEVPLQPVQKVATPGCMTIQAVANFLGVPTSQTLKAVFFVQERPSAPGRFVFAVIRGDLEINEVKLLRALGGGTLRAATDDEITAAGAVPGYASPIGLPPEVTVIADRSVRAGTNFVSGANDAGFHLTGVNVPRDFDPTLVADIAAAFDGATCARCGQGTLRVERAIELGHCFKLGTRYSEAAGVTYTDETGAEHLVVMGSYGIGLERLMAAIIETHHDEWGIIWPASVAPFDVHLLMLGKDPQLGEIAARLYDDLRAAGLDVLLDDRAESAGVKFTDADLIGIPVRLAVSSKALAAGGVEAKRRDSAERIIVPLDEIAAWVRG